MSNFMKGGIYDSPEDCYTKITETRHNHNKHNSDYKYTDTSYNIFLLDAMGMTIEASDAYIEHTKADDGENSSGGKPILKFLFDMF